MNVDAASRAALEDEARTFAMQLMETLSHVLPSGNLGFSCLAAHRDDGSARMSVASAEIGGLVLTVNGEPRLQLQVDYELVVSPGSGRAAVRRSAFRVRPFGEGRLLFSLDYVRDARSNIPAAHYNFHFEHSELVAELLETGKSRRGAIYRRDVRKGRKPQLADLHFPVGGHRFRPCLEDVLDMLWSEFGIDVQPSAHEAIATGRRGWRAMQLRAAVTDDPHTAVSELRKLGFTVWMLPWRRRHHAARDDRLTAI